jgi:uncharacterized membrane protein
MRERGQISLLIIGFAVILLALVAVVVDASQVVLLRRSLASVADGAALAGAQSLAVHPLYAGEAVGSLPIDAARAQQSVVSYLAATDMDLSLVGVVVDGDRVTVEVAAQARLPLVGIVTTAFDGTVVTARASARSPIA